MSIRLTGRASLQGETIEALTEAFTKAAQSLTDQAADQKHRVVWDTVSIKIEVVNHHSFNGALDARYQSFAIEALCVEEPGDEDA